MTRVTVKATRELIDDLHQLRLDRDLSYDELAEQIGISPRNLFRVMNDRKAAMRDRTAHKLRLYIQSQTEDHGTTEAVASS